MGEIAKYNLCLVAQVGPCQRRVEAFWARHAGGPVSKLAGVRLGSAPAEHRGETLTFWAPFVCSRRDGHKVGLETSGSNRVGGHFHVIESIRRIKKLVNTHTRLRP